MPKASRKVVVARQAEQDLRNLLSYFRRKLMSPKTARAFVAEYKQKIELILAFPDGFPLDSEVSARVGYPVRKIIVQHQKVLYRYVENKNAVYVLAIRHEREDLASTPYLEFDSSAIQIE